MRSSIKAFSLLEILAAVVIVAILAALLTASLRNLSESGLNVKCVNRLRSTASAVSLFVSDSNGTFRTWARGSSATGTLVWGKSLVDREYLSKETLRCPAAADVYTLDEGAWYHNTYGFNLIDAAGERMQPAGQGQDYSLKFASVANPTKHIILADSATLAFIKPGVRSETFRFNMNKSTDGVQLRHKGRVNVAFMDGHVEALDREDAAEFFDDSLIYEDNQ